MAVLRHGGDKACPPSPHPREWTTPRHLEGHARTSAKPDHIKHVAAGIAERYYPAQPAQDLAESFVQEGFTAVRVSITNVIAGSGLG
jgi:hypothetical protein